jgi:hypothetical protein
MRNFWHSWEVRTEGEKGRLPAWALHGGYIPDGHSREGSRNIVNLVPRRLVGCPPRSETKNVSEVEQTGWHLLPRTPTQPRQQAHQNAEVRAGVPARMLALLLDSVRLGANAPGVSGEERGQGAGGGCVRTIGRSLSTPEGRGGGRWWLLHHYLSMEQRS